MESEDLRPIFLIYHFDHLATAYDPMFATFCLKKFIIN